MLKDRIRKLRTERKLSQIVLGSQLNLSQQAIAKWESGKSEPDSENIMKLSEIFEVDVNYLLGKSNIRNPIEKEYLNSKESDALEVYNKLIELNDGKHLSQNQKSALISFLENNTDYIRFAIDKNK